MLLFPVFMDAETLTHSIVDTAETLEDLSHPCTRECATGDFRICHYTFKVEWYITMSKACYDCPFNITDCSRRHCAAADGYERPLVTVNRRLPGPSIHVCVGDELVVDVINELGSDSTSIHWHGLHQWGTPYMDGVAFLTQCPITAGTTFRYHFLADHPGTHYWHSHSGFQRADGMFGSLVIREPREHDPQKHLYDEDDFRHMFVLTDWLDGLGIEKFVNHHHTEHDNKPYNLLVNGRGKHVKFARDGTEVYTPVQEFIVKPGRRHRFRALSNSIQNCPIVISVDNHTLLPITTDGSPIQPVEVESLTIYGGERWDFVVNASQSIATYWIRFQGMLDCDDRFKSAHQVAVLRYEGAEGFPGSLDHVDYNSTVRQGLATDTTGAVDPASNPTTQSKHHVLKTNLNTLTCVTAMNGCRHGSTYDTSYSVVVTNNNDTSPINLSNISITSDFHADSSQNLVHKMSGIYYSVFAGQRYEIKSHVGSQSLGEDVSAARNNQIDHSVPEKRGVKSGYLSVVYWANHPFHLHGHAFQVLAMGRLGENTTLRKVQEMDAAGLIERNFDRPPIKDTVTVPDGGYTIVRFIASNPGYWLFHCHISFHIEVGMGLVFHVGDQTMLPPVPKNFPRCGHWTPDPDPNFKSNLVKYYKTLNEGKISVNLDLLPTDNDTHPGPSYSTPTHKTPHHSSTNSVPGQTSDSSRNNLVASCLIILMIYMNVSM
nr:uncharacterized protein LOC128700086 [Cherax quadricarinatus]